MSYGTWTIFVISCISITPLPSTSYMRNAHFSFSSGVPLDVTSIANRNSCNKSRWYPVSVTLSQLRDIKTFISSLQKNLAFVWNENLFPKVWLWYALKGESASRCYNSSNFVEAMENIYPLGIQWFEKKSSKIVLISKMSRLNN